MEATMGRSISRGEIEKALAAAVSGETDSRRTMELDIRKYQALLKDIDIPEGHKEQMIEALWSIVVAFVEIGYGVHPVQQACGKVNENNNKSSIDGAGDLYCDDSSILEVTRIDNRHRPKPTLE